MPNLVGTRLLVVDDDDVTVPQTWNSMTSGNVIVDEGDDVSSCKESSHSKLSFALEEEEERIFEVVGGGGVAGDNDDDDGRMISRCAIGVFCC